MAPAARIRPLGSPGSAGAGTSRPWYGVGAARAAALAPDGSVVVGTELGVARYGPGGALRWFQGVEAPCVSVAVSAGGEALAWATLAGDVTVWSVARGEAVCSLPAGARHVAISGDGAAVAVGGPRGVTVWDARAAVMTAAPDGTSQEVTGVAMSADGRLVAATDYAGHALVWNARSGARVADLRPAGAGRGGAGALRGVALSPDGARVAAVGAGWTVWDVAMGAVVCAGRAPGPLLCAAFGPRGDALVTGSARGRAYVWDLATGERALEVRGHASEVHSVAVTAGGDEILCASRRVSLVSRATGEVTATLPVLGRVRHLAFDAGGARVAIADHALVTVWDRDGEPRAVLGEHSRAIAGVRLAPGAGGGGQHGDGDGGGGQHGGGDGGGADAGGGGGARDSDGGGLADLVVSWSAREVIGWDARTGRRRYVIAGADALAADVARARGPGEPLVLAVATAEGSRVTVAIHDAATGRRVRAVGAVGGRGFGPGAVAVSPDGGAVALRLGGEVTAWRPAERSAGEADGGAAGGAAGVRVTDRALDRDQVIAWSPDSAVLAVGTRPGPIELWAVDAGAAGARLVRRIDSGGAGASGLVFGPGGRWLAASVRDEPRDRIYAWDVATGALRLGPLEGDDVVQALAAGAVSGGGALLAAAFSSAPGSGAWSVWDADTGEALTEQRGPAMWAIAFAPGGDRLVVGTGHGSAEVWRIDADAAAPG